LHVGAFAQDNQLPLIVFREVLTVAHVVASLVKLMPEGQPGRHNQPSSRHH
jgi:hypothetical protein